MKKLFCIILSFITGLFCFANQYKIKDIQYDITPSAIKFLGTTKTYCLEQKVSINFNRIFDNEEDLLDYINNYKTRLNNTRVFETVEVSFEVLNNDNDNDVYDVILKVLLTDSFHLFILPGPKYDSNTGLILKFKVKDFNFLGSLNMLSSDIYFLIPTSESEAVNAEFGLNFSFDYPFKAGIFNATWVNDLGISYTVNNSSPEWDIKTGLKFERPYEHFSFIAEAYQKSVNDFDYEDFGDSLYFSEEIDFSLPIKLTSTNSFGDLIYKPYINSYFNWDFDSISKNNTSLSSPIIEAGHSLSLGRTNWNDNLRIGFEAELLNYYKYNFQREIFYPITELELKGYNNIELFDYPICNRIGLTTRLYSFIYMFDPLKDDFLKYDGISIGSKLRGIRDDQEYSNSDIKSLTSTAGFVLNLDFPYHIFSTNFTKSIFRYCNFDFQISPFIDIALTYNKINNTWFNPKDGFYSAGIEFIVYPTKFSGITVRANFGYDIGRKFLKNYLNMDWRGDAAMYELYFGLGLNY